MTIIGALPSTLINGTVNDATQVQADLQWIVDQTNSNAQSAGSSAGFQTNLQSGTPGNGVDLVGGSIRVVNSIASLRTQLKTGNGRAFVLGYYVPGDGGGGQYYYDATDTTSTDNGGTIIVAADGGRWKLSGQTSVSICQFGADKSGVLDSTAAILAALTAVAYCTAPAGTFTVSAITLVPAGRSLVGSGQGVTTFNITVDAVLFRAVAQNVTLDSFSCTRSGAHTSAGIEVGDNAAANARLCTLRNLTVTGMGSHGIRVRQGNLGHGTNLVCVSNGGAGIFHGIETINTNAWTYDGFNSVQSNAGGGFVLQQASSQNDTLASRSHTILSMCAQQNTGYGVYIGTPGNVATLYIEASTTTDLYLDTFAYGNLVMLTQASTIVDVGAGTSFNQILFQNAGAAKWRQWQGKVLFAGGAGNGYRISNTDGTAGVLDLEKTGSVTYAFKAQTSGQDQTLQFINTSGSFHLNLQAGTVFPIDATVSVGSSSSPWNLGWFNSMILLGAPANPGSGVTIGGTVGTTVGAPGGASALPATPKGYINAFVAGSAVRIPYYN